MSTSTTTTSVSVLNLLGVAFIVLKLTGYITWSWWWVLAPFWAPWDLVLVVFCIGLFIFVGGSTK